MTPTEDKGTMRERFEEISFIACPTEEKEPFFWKWTEEGKETLLSFIESECERREREVIQNLENAMISADLNPAQKVIITEHLASLTPPK